jgi:hypothetical protein
MRPLAAGERVLEYKGEITAWHDAVRRHRREGVKGHTFLFGLSDGRVIDGSCGGNSSRWLNHSCAPNCESIEDGGRIFIHTLWPIEAGEELSIEYLLATDDPMDEDLRAQYACRCAAAGCRQSMLSAATWAGGQAIDGSTAIPESGRHPRHENDGFVRIGVDMILHLDELKATLPKEDASGEAFSTSTTKQMSLDLEDL